MLVLPAVRSSSRSFVVPSEGVGGRVETASRLASLVVFPEAEVFGESCDNSRTVRGKEVERRKQNEPSTGPCTHSLLVRSEYEHVMNQVRYSSTVLLYRRFTRVQDADTVLYCIHGCKMLSSSHHNWCSLLSV